SDFTVIQSPVLPTEKDGYIPLEVPNKITDLPRGVIGHAHGVADGLAHFAGGGNDHITLREYLFEVFPLRRSKHITGVAGSCECIVTKGTWVYKNQPGEPEVLDCPCSEPYIPLVERLDQHKRDVRHPAAYWTAVTVAFSTSIP